MSTAVINIEGEVGHCLRHSSNIVHSGLGEISRVEYREGHPDVGAGQTHHCDVEPERISHPTLITDQTQTIKICRVGTC